VDPATVTSKPSIRVGSFNVHHGLNAHGHPGLDATLAALAALRADIAGLQEIDGRRLGPHRAGKVGGTGWAGQVNRARRATAMHATFGPVSQRGLFGCYGNALLVRGSIGAVENEALPTGSASAPRRVLVASVTIGETDLTVAVTHLSVHRSEALSQLNVAAGSLASRSGPLVLLGDLNLGPADVAGVLDPLGFALAGGGPTYPSRAPRARIDHIAVRGLALGAAEVGTSEISDHCPVVVPVEVGPVRGSTTLPR